VRLADWQSGIEVVDREGCLHLLAQQEIGRLAFVIGGSPEILPVNYVLDGDAVVLRTAPGRKLDGALRSPVAFEVDATDRATHAGWSVVVHGHAEEVTRLDREELVRRVAALHVEPWAGGDKPHVLRIVPTSITGRRIPPRPRA
jgi:nitroimidazol reductase NimA-like FMN-containing flavoprotein (pyridoxamine 5'-phosphate oxidase superfamily)